MDHIGQLILQAAVLATHSIIVLGEILSPDNLLFVLWPFALLVFFKLHYFHPSSNKVIVRTAVIGVVAYLLAYTTIPVDGLSFMRSWNASLLTAGVIFLSLIWHMFRPNSRLRGPY